MNTDGLPESQRSRREIRDSRITGASRGLAPGFVQAAKLPLFVTHAAAHSFITDLPADHLMTA